MFDRGMFTITCNNTDDLILIFNTINNYNGPIIASDIDIITSKGTIIGYLEDTSYSHESDDFQNDFLVYIYQNVVNDLVHNKFHATLKTLDRDDLFLYTVGEQITCINDEYEFYHYKYLKIIDEVNKICETLVLDEYKIKQIVSLINEQSILVE